MNQEDGEIDQCVTDDAEVLRKLKEVSGEGKTKHKEKGRRGKENVVTSNKGLTVATQAVEENMHKEVALEKNEVSISRPEFNDKKLSKISSDSLVNTSFDMSSVVENIFEESMVLDGDEDCCPTGSPSIRKRVSWGGKLIQNRLKSVQLFK